jgi:hypothetical protein
LVSAVFVVLWPAIQRLLTPEENGEVSCRSREQSEPNAGTQELRCERGLALGEGQVKPSAELRVSDGNRL